MLLLRLVPLVVKLYFSSFVVLHILLFDHLLRLVETLPLLIILLKVQLIVNKRLVEQLLMVLWL